MSRGWPSRLGDDVAAVWVETPSRTGAVETQLRQIADAAHAVGAVLVVGTDPIGYGVLDAARRAGRRHRRAATSSRSDCTSGSAAPTAASSPLHDDPRFIMEMPSRLFGLATTDVPGEYGFGDVAYDRTSFAHREEGKEWVGTAAALWGIAAGVYLALMGPQGMRDLGEVLLARTRYAQQRLAAIPGIAPRRRRGAPARVHDRPLRRRPHRAPASSTRSAPRASSPACPSASTRCSSASPR